LAANKRLGATKMMMMRRAFTNLSPFKCTIGRKNQILQYKINKNAFTLRKQGCATTPSPTRLYESSLSNNKTNNISDNDNDGNNNDNNNINDINQEDDKTKKKLTKFYEREKWRIATQVYEFTLKTHTNFPYSTKKRLV
jgi:hypothetical protein